MKAIQWTRDDFHDIDQEKAQELWDVQYWTVRRLHPNYDYEQPTLRTMGNILQHSLYCDGWRSVDPAELPELPEGMR